MLSQRAKISVTPPLTEHPVTELSVTEVLENSLIEVFGHSVTQFPLTEVLENSLTEHETSF